MYLRWKRKVRRGKNPDKGSRITLCAVLVESHRENGKIKQTVIKYLGSIRHEHIQFSSRRHRFRRKAKQNLLTVDIPEQTRKTILSKLQEVVPKSIDDEISEPRFAVREKLRNFAR
jgi:hypothetical protein